MKRKMRSALHKLDKAAALLAEAQRDLVALQYSARNVYIEVSVTANRAAETARLVKQYAENIEPMA